MIQRTKSLAQLNTRAWRVLVDQLGVVDALRFLGQFDKGSGNYATHRDEWQEGLTVDEIVASIQRRKKSQAAKKPSRFQTSRAKRPKKGR